MNTTAQEHSNDPTASVREEAVTQPQKAAAVQESDGTNAEQNTVMQEDGTDGAPQEQSAEPQNDAVAAPVRTHDEEKKRAAVYLIFAAIVLAGIYIVQIFHVFDSLFDRIYYGNLTTIFFYICNAVFWIPFIVLLYKFVYKYTGYKLFRKSDPLPLKRSLIIYVCAVVPIFIVSAVLGFELKVVVELGKKVTGMQLATNAASYAHGAIKLILAVIFIELVQEAGQLLYKGKYGNRIPWGGIALALSFGFAEVIVAYATGTSTAFLFSWMYIAFDLLYGIIYLLGEKNFFVTYFVSLIIYIL